MIKEELKIENNTKNIKLYSSNSICGATFLGGPLAATYLISKNFKALSKPKQSLHTLIIGIAFTIILFSGIFMIPDRIFNNIPRQLIPFVSIGIIWGIVEWKQGSILKVHKLNNNPFYSGWRAAGIGLLSLLITCACVFGYYYLSTDNEMYEKYDAEIAKFSKNETETLVFFDNLNTKNDKYLLKELEEKTIPKWKENIEIIHKINQFNDLPSNLINQNKILLKYSELRVKSFELYRKALIEGSEKLAPQIEEISVLINMELEKLK